ncbi:MAG: CBS domain-containing protein [Actinomycetota bacterium]|nr:CBS domain-containing protein [Actinomycetota bacterium]
MLISNILRHKSAGKGAAVVTIAPTETIVALLAVLAEHRIGAVVAVDGDRVAGIVSERDVVRRLHQRGADVLEATVSDIMTSPVVTCAPDDSVNGVATLMTDRRFRHMPVLDHDRLVGIVSIGDVVSSRMRGLEQDREHLEQYITG